MKLSIQDLLQLPCLYTDADFRVYRLDTSDYGRPVIIKLLQPEQPTVRQQARLVNEYEITKDLALPGIRRAREKLTVDGRMALVLDYVEGETVKRALVEQRRSLGEILEVALAVTRVLGDLHQRTLIHKSISSHNLLVAFPGPTVTLIDFGAAAYAYLKDRQPDNVADWGTLLPYISPEQTGRTNRAVDYRTDFYSLGVTLYEMLSGQLPFDAADPAELVYYHIAKSPQPVCEIAPDAPPVVAEIVMKLLDKNPEQRYQSAYGLIADLENCLAQLRAAGKIERFSLGQADFSGRLQIPQRLYGREAAIQTLHQALEGVSRGSREIALISGDPGVGKSSLAAEIQPRVAALHGYFIVGKCDAYQQNMPYYGLIQALTDLVNQMLMQSGERLARHRAEILQAVGDNGALLVEMLPNLELILGPQQAASDFGPAEAQYHFQQTFQSFVRAVARKEHPLVLFIDNLQWVDAATLNLLKGLLTNVENRYLLFVGAYRTDETPDSHPLIATLQELTHEKAVILHQIRLENLPAAPLNQLIEEALQSKNGYIAPLTALVYEKTGGNPFFAIEFLASLPEEGALAFDYDLKKWRWDEARIRATDIPATMTAFVMRKVEKLTESTQQVLALAACIGNVFDLKMLAALAEQPVDALFQEIETGVQEGFVLPPPNYEILRALEAPQKLEAEGHFEFVNDRVRQTLHSLLNRRQKRTVYLTIGRVYLQTMTPGELEEHIFDVTDRLNEGFQHIKDAQETLQLAELNLRAGRRAKTATAYKTAIWYFSMGIGMLPPRQKWIYHYDLTLAFYREAVEAEYLNSTFERAEQLAKEALEHVEDTLSQAPFYRFLILVYIAQNRNAQALETGRRALEALECALPTAPEEAAAFVTAARQEVGDRFSSPEALAALPEMRDPQQLAVLRLLSVLAVPARRTGAHLLAAVALKMATLVLHYGNSPLAAVAYVLYAAELCGRLDEIEAGYRLGQWAVDQVSNSDTTVLRPRVEFIFNALIRPWKEHTSVAIEALQRGYRLGLEIGELEYAYYSALHSTSYQFCLGSELAAIHQQQTRYLENTAKFRLEFHHYFGAIWGKMMLNLMEPGATPGRLSGALLDEAELLPRWLAQGNVLLTFNVYCCQTLLHYLFGNYAEAVQAATAAEAYAQDAAGFLYQALYYFYYALTLLAHYPEVEAAAQATYMEKVTALQTRLQRWATHTPMNFQHKADLVAAERARVTGDAWQALEFYGRAIRGARKYAYLHEEALAYEREGLFYLTLDREDLARFCLTQARDAYRAWGAARKVSDLEKRHRRLLLPSALGAPAPGPVEATPLVTSLDTASIIKVSQTLSQEVRLESLLDRVIHIVMENAGAERGILIENKEDTLLIQARGEIGQTAVATMLAAPVEDNANVPLSIIHYVARTQTPVVLSDAAHDSVYAADPYIAAQHPKSLLCLPIVHQSKLVGLLYLENNLTTNAFTQDRVELLRILSGQAAISMENAGLYRNLENTISALQAAQEALAIRVRYEEGLATCSQMLLADAEDSLTEALRHLQRVANVSRVYLFENFTDPQAGLCMRQTHEVCAPGVVSYIDDPQFQGLPYKEGAQRWADTLGAGEPMVGLVADFPAAERAILEPQGVLSILVLPIRVSGAWYGFIGFDDTRTPRAWTSQDIHLLQTAAGVIANYIERRRAERAAVEAETAQALAAAEAASAQELAAIEAEKARALATLNTISRQLTGILNLNDLLAQVVTMTQETFHYYHVHIYLLNAAGDALVLAEGYGEAGAAMKRMGHKISLDHPTSLTARAAREGRIVAINDVRVEPGWVAPPFLVDVRAKIAVPIVQNEAVAGILTVYSDRVGGLGSSDADLLQSLANQVAVAMTNARLFEEVAHSNVKLEEQNVELEAQSAQLMTQAAELEEAKEAAEQARAAAEQASQAKSEFLSSMSHELRTPLNGILGYAQILKRGADLTPMQRNGLNIIQQSGEHLLTLINDILDLSKIEARKLELYPTDFNFSDFLQGVSGIISLRAQNKGLGFALDMLPPLPDGVHADEKRLRQVLINLLTNAVKFTDHGSVTLRVQEIITSRTTEGVKLLRFAVIDTGVGIPEEHLERIFVPFEQTEAGKKQAEGTGLGLAISRQIVQMMESELLVESVVGQGSTFWFDLALPVAAVRAREMTTVLQDIVGYAGPKRKILLADDKEHNRTLLRNILAPLGFEVLEADDGLVCVTLAQQAHPDVVITDMIMPGLTGFEATQRIRQIPELKDVVIFGTSASVFAGEQQKVKLTGCDAFLSKPVEIKQLLDLLSEHLHLQWRYTDTETVVAAPPPTEFVAPPQTDLNALYEIAKLGNMRRVGAWAEELRARDARYAAFATKVQELAQSFQKKQIVALVEQYLEEQ
ncbi:MAG TPA: AAA family ATPase [Anaerolineae bacterium]|nr:AAA family ATPase [Anaerolineae bacterium]